MRATPPLDHVPAPATAPALSPAAGYFTLAFFVIGLAAAFWTGFSAGFGRAQAAHAAPACDAKQDRLQLFLPPTGGEA